MLELVRQYALERLQESGEAAETRWRHAAYFLGFAEQAAAELERPRQVLWLKRLEEEHNNLRTTMVLLLEQGELEMAVRLGWGLWRFWWIRGHFIEGRRWMEEALARGTAMPVSLRAKALFITGTMATGQGDHRSAAPLLEESLRLFRELGDKRGAAYALGSAGIAAVGQELYERGIGLFEEGADLFLEWE